MQDAERDRVFGAWMAAHEAILFKVARAYGPAHPDREDLFQEIALQVWRSVDAFRGEAAITTWIYRVALNTALAWKRRETSHRAGKLDLESGVLVSPPASNPRLDWIYGQIAALDEANRSVALLMLDGFSYREMSEILGISETHVGVKIHRIKAALAGALAKESDDGPR